MLTVKPIHYYLKHIASLLMNALLLLVVSPVTHADVTIAVAANFTQAARDLAARFEETSGNKVKLSFGSTGQLYAQIINGAPYDVFLAADTERPQKAENDRYAVRGSRFTYARGRLVLVSINSPRVKDGPAFLKSGNFARLAIANPKTAPYGFASKQVLDKLNLWQGLQHKIVRGNSIAQTYQFMATGNTEAGFVARSQLLTGNTSEKQTIAGSWLVPESFHDPIEQQAVLLTRGAGNAAASAFLQFMQSDEAHAIINQYGYTVSERKPA